MYREIQALLGLNPVSNFFFFFWGGGGVAIGLFVFGVNRGKGFSEDFRVSGVQAKFCCDCVAAAAVVAVAVECWCISL